MDDTREIYRKYERVESAVQDMVKVIAEHKLTVDEATSALIFLNGAVKQMTLVISPDVILSAIESQSDDRIDEIIEQETQTTPTHSESTAEVKGNAILRWLMRFFNRWQRKFN